MTIGVVIVLVVLGLVLVAAELFVPGAVLGVLGTLALLAAVVLTYTSFSFWAGTILLCSLAVFGVASFALWLRFFPQTWLGRKMALPSAIVGNAAEPRLGELIGHTGVSHTALRPSGTAILDGRRVDVLAEGEFVAQGQTVQVSRVEGAAVFVRSLGSPSEARR